MIAQAAANPSCTFRGTARMGRAETEISAESEDASMEYSEFYSRRIDE